MGVRAIFVFARITKNAVFGPILLLITLSLISSMINLKNSGQYRKTQTSGHYNGQKLIGAVFDSYQ